MAEKKTVTAKAPTAEESGSRLDEIRQRAYEHYVQRGCEHGHDLEDWAQAEAEVSSAHTEPLHAKK